MENGGRIWLERIHHKNLKVKLEEITKQLEKLLDVYLNEVITTEKYTLRKQRLLNEKLEIGEQIKDFEQKGLSWLEPTREFILSLAKGDKLKKSEDYSEILTFLKNIGSNHYLQNRKWYFEAKIPYNLVAARSGANSQILTFPTWCPRPESNRHGFLGQRILSPSCLPIPPLGHSTKIQVTRDNFRTTFKSQFSIFKHLEFLIWILKFVCELYLVS